MIPAIWTAMYAQLPLNDALRALQAYGWRAFEISSEHMVAIENDRDPDGLAEKIRDSLRAGKWAAPQAHAYLGADVADPDADKREQDIRRLLRHTEIAARLGVRQVVMHPGGKRGSTQAEQIAIHKLNIEAYRRLGDFAGEVGVRIGIENLPYPGSTTAAEILELRAQIDRPSIGITIDTSHANMSAQDIPAMIRAFGPHLIATHISDNNGSGDQHLTPGGGTIDWPAVMQAFGEIGYEGLFNLEIPGERHRVPALRELKLRHAFNVAQWLVTLPANQQHPSGATD